MDNDLLFRRAPPVRIGLRMAAIRGREMVREAPLSGQGNRTYPDAGEFGMRETRFESVPVMLRFVRNAGPASNIALRNVKAINFTNRKRGYPMPELPSQRVGSASAPGGTASGSARNWAGP